MTSPHILVIGAGSTSAAIAHDLALRGVQVERATAILNMQKELLISVIKRKGI
jgi:shikimate 5-dehydrogenase